VHPGFKQSMLRHWVRQPYMEGGWETEKQRQNEEYLPWRRRSDGHMECTVKKSSQLVLRVDLWNKVMPLKVTTLDELDL
jgi:hypothetical protein